MSNSVSPSPLLSLPAELRNNTFALALTQDQTVNIPISGRVAHPALLRTCRQVNAEASQLYYSNTKFHATITTDEDLELIAWLTSIGNANAKAMTSMSITCDLTASMKDRCYQQYHREIPPTPVFEEATGIIRIRKSWADFAGSLFGTGLRASAVHLVKLEEKKEEPYQMWAYRAQQQKASEMGTAGPLSWAMRDEALGAQEGLVEARAKDSKYDILIDARKPHSIVDLKNAACSLQLENLVRAMVVSKSGHGVD